MDVRDRLFESLKRKFPRKAPKLSAIAMELNLNPTTFRSYYSANNTREPTLETCEIIGPYFGVSGRWLKTGKGNSLPLHETLEGPADLTRVPLLDEVSAGKLANPASQTPVEEVPLLAFADLGPGEFFALRVAGTSMERVSPEGSVIVINRHDQDLINGRCYVFAYQGTTTYKRWQGGDPSYLEPYSFDVVHKPIFVKKMRGLEIIGRVKRTVLDL